MIINSEEVYDVKLKNISEIKRKYKEFLLANQLKVEAVVEVSSLIDWMDTDGNENSASHIAYLNKYDIDNLQICFDGRYNIDKLRETMEDAIKDSEAVMGLRMALRLEELVRKNLKMQAKNTKKK